MERIGKLEGKSTRMGVCKCYECRKPFLSSKTATSARLQAIYLIAASKKKGISANQLHRVLGVTLKTAWYVGHRIRLAAQTQPEGRAVNKLVQPTKKKK
jgi:hypothetical protein